MPDRDRDPPAAISASIGLADLRPVRGRHRRVFADALLDALDVAAPQRLHLAAELKERVIFASSSIPKSGHHGWVYGWKLHIASVVASVWIPVAATVTPANRADNEEAVSPLPEVPMDTRFVLGDTNYNAPNVQEMCERHGRIPVATLRGPYPHTDRGVEVRRIFHKLRSLAIENLNEHFK